MKKLFLSSVLASILLASGSANAVVIMTHHTLAVYDPAETYVPLGVLGPDILSFGWIYTNPAYSNTINLVTPNDLVGFLDWAVTSGMDATGISYFDGSLLAGQSDSVVMQGGDFASPSNPITAWFSMQALDIGTPLAFGPTIDNGPISFPGDGDTGNGGGGNGGGTGNSVPEPGTLALMMGGIMALGLTARRRKFNPLVS